MADQLSRAFQALADPTRRDLVARLAADGDASVGDLAAPYDVTVQAVSKHVKVLEEAGLVSRSRDAQRRPVHLEAEVLDLMTKWIERYRREAEERFGRLDDVWRAMEISTGSTTERTNERGSSIMRDARTRPGSRRSRTCRSSASSASSRPRPSGCSGRTSTPTCSRSGAARAASTPTIDVWDARTGGEWRYTRQPRRRRLRRRLLGLLPRGPPARADRADLDVRRRSPTASAWRRRPSRRSTAAAAAWSARRSSSRSRSATRSCPAAWRPACSRATRSSTSCSRRSSEHAGRAPPRGRRRRSPAGSWGRPTGTPRRPSTAGSRATSSAPGRPGSRLPGVAAPASGSPRGPSVDEDPVAAWHAHADGVQALLDDPATPTRC